MWPWACLWTSSPGFFSLNSISQPPEKGNTIMLNWDLEGPNSLSSIVLKEVKKPRFKSRQPNSRAYKLTIGPCSFPVPSTTEESTAPKSVKLCEANTLYSIS